MTQHEQTADIAQYGTRDAASEGPPDGLPDAVPDVVGEIHTTINDVIGGVEDLGDAISGIAANGGGGEAVAMVADAAMVLPG